MSKIIQIIRSEPAVVSGFIAAAIALVVAFGLKLSPEQIGAVMALVSAGLAFVTRSQVSPVVNLPTPATPSPMRAGAVTMNAANNPGTAGTANIAFPYIPPVAPDPTVPAAGS
jgi:hypothetical protein